MPERPGESWEWRFTAHDPQTMQEVARSTFTTPSRSAHALIDEEHEFTQSHHGALIVRACRPINLGQTNRVGSWRIDGTVRP